MKNLRELAGYTQDKLAEKIGIPKDTIQHYEKGQILPTLKRFVEIAKILNVSLKTLAQSLEIDVSEICNDD